MRATVAALALLAASVPAIAQAQATACAMPQDFRMPRVTRVDPAEVRRTPVTRYTLSYSWSPQHCFEQQRRGQGGDDDLQCGGQPGRFGFVLHGLWPETSGRDWPQYCRPATAVSRATLRQHLCMTPSAELLQHEWERHGTCMSSTPEAYFDQAAALHRNVRFPDMAALAERRDVTVRDLRRAISAANVRIPVDAIAVTQNRGGWLDEVRLCLNLRYRATRCAPSSRGAPDGARLRITRPR